ncbi:MAG: hypothetical protein ACOYB7_09370 [Mycobacterium sp.]
MLIVALVLAVIGLAALVTAVVTSNELIAWVCIAASSLGVILLIVDAIRERQLKRVRPAGAALATAESDEPDDATDEVNGEFVADEIRDDEIFAEEIRDEDHPEELVHDEPDYDTYSDDEPEYPEAAEESALHTVLDVDAEEAEKSPG